MGLLKAFFKKKFEKLPPQSVESGAKDVVVGLETLQIQDTHGQKSAGPLPNSSPPAIKPPPWDFHPAKDQPAISAEILGDNPLDSVVDIEATSLEAVDYTHEEEASQIGLHHHISHQNQREIEEAASSEQQITSSNVVEEGVQVDQQELESLRDDTAPDSEPAPEQLEEDQHLPAATTPADAGASSPPAALTGDLSMSLAPLQSVLYLTEDNENMADTISVISDGGGVSLSAALGGGGDAIAITNNEKATAELVEELSELGRALETMEAEGIPGSPLSAIAAAGPAAGNVVASSVISSAGQAHQEPQQPSSPGGSMSTTSVSADGARFSSNMVKLYNDLALRLMDAREYDQALQMLSKAEAILDNDAVWAPPAGILASVGSGSLDNSNSAGGGVSGSVSGGGGGASSTSPFFDRNHSGSFNLSNMQESSLDEAAFNAAAATLAGMDGFQIYLDKIAAKRNRLRAITYNNIGCLYKRRSLPERALTYLQNALALEEAAGDVHDCASTHLNLCASYSALIRFREALAHAERAIILLQRQLWGPTAASFQDGMTYLGRVLAALGAIVAAGPSNGGGGNTINSSSSAGTTTAAVAATYAEAYKRQRKLLANANILAMAYHNAAVEHERLNRLREAQVSYSRASSIGTKFLGAKSSTTVALIHAQKGFIARQQREAGGVMQTHHSSGGGSGGGGGGTGSGTKGHVMTSRSSTNLASKARQGSSTAKRTPLGGASSSSRMAKSSSSSIASKLGRDRR
jgi:tetratricopeptide (TPR) repeat protein